jgi:hypothetical protein
MRARAWGEKRNPISTKAGIASNKRLESIPMFLEYNRVINKYHIHITAQNIKGGTHRTNSSVKDVIVIKKAEKQ